MAFTNGENVGPYRIVEQLGQGGMASVFKAYHPALDRYVAIKVLHQAFLEDPNFLARFQREARVVARLEHPNIVPVYDFAEHQGQPYLVMKYIQGITLKKRLKESAVGREEGLRIIEAVGQGLSYAHQQGILHRDIKPSNVLLADDGGIYLADFGLARIAQAGESTLSNEMLLGTPQYISPEQARGERHLDAGTDIYSFGVVVYEMVVGRVPFNADTPFSIVHDHIYTPLPLPRAINRRVPEKVELVLLKALAKDRADRFETVDDMVAAFRAALDGKPLPATRSKGQSLVPTESLPGSGSDSSASEPAPPADDLEGRDGPLGGKRRSRRWVWAAVGLVFACSCFGLFLLAANRSNQRNGAGATSTAQVVATQAVGRFPSTAVAVAAATANSDPRNPQAQVELARALATADQPAQAANALLAAANTMMAQGNFEQAAKMLTQGDEELGGPSQSDPRYAAVLLRALFMTAASPEQVSPLVAQLRKSYPQWDGLLPIEARSALYRDQLDQASLLAARAIRGQPNDWLAQSVQAEIQAKRGMSAAAQRTIDAILAQSGPPDWIRSFLTELQKSL